jgi:glycosyltransferase involved in cell wall biosynthesis
MDKRPQISVLVPVYNTEKYLPACLDSVLSQSMTDFEIVAVNDASTDGSPRILAEYAAKDSRIRLINHPCNKGLLAVRLTGIRAAKGKYIMFLDSDDRFLPGVMKLAFEAAETKKADIVHFPMEIHRRLKNGKSRKEKYAYPFKHQLDGKEIFKNYFVDNAYFWMVCMKLYRVELCRKAIEFIPDQFCLMAEDFCLYTLCAFFAERYVPLRQPGYVYYLDSGISSGQKTTLEKFEFRLTPFQALRTVRNFLQQQGVWEKYRDAFEKHERDILINYVNHWFRFLSDYDKTPAFNFMFRDYDSAALFRAFRSYFDEKDETVPEMLTGEDPQPVPCPEKLNRPADRILPRNEHISLERWREWETLIRQNNWDAVILEPDADPERLLWDILAVRSAGAAAVCRQAEGYLSKLERDGMKVWLLEDRVLRQASAVLASDDVSAEWYRRRGCRSGTSLETLLPPQRSPETSAFMTALAESEKKTGYYRIDPSEDGETFVPFFRKLDHVFRKLPKSFRKRFFGFLARSYDRIFNQ